MVKILSLASSRSFKVISPVFSVEGLSFSSLTILIATPGTRCVLKLTSFQITDTVSVTRT